MIICKCCGSPEVEIEKASSGKNSGASLQGITGMFRKHPKEKNTTETYAKCYHCGYRWKV